MSRSRWGLVKGVANVLGLRARGSKKHLDGSQVQSEVDDMVVRDDGPEVIDLETLAILKRNGSDFVDFEADNLYDSIADAGSIRSVGSSRKNTPSRHSYGSSPSLNLNVNLPDLGSDESKSEYDYTTGDDGIIQPTRSMKAMTIPPGDTIDKSESNERTDKSFLHRLNARRRFLQDVQNHQGSTSQIMPKDSKVGLRPKRHVQGNEVHPEHAYHDPAELESSNDCESRTDYRV